MSLGSWTCPGVSTQLRPGVPEGLHEDRELFRFTPRKEGVTRWLSLHREALSLHGPPKALFALTRSKPTPYGQGDNPS